MTKETHLDIEVLRVVEHGTDVLGLSLHVYLLNLALLDGGVPIAGSLDLVLCQSSIESCL